jgi:predicted dehydrogenase
MINAGLIGLGKMGISHYSIINAHHDVNVVAVCDMSGMLLEAVSQFGQAQTFKDYNKMFDQCPMDCVVISTPTSSHAALVKSALERGLHVFVEKPFCLKVSEGQALTKSAEEKKRVNQVGYHYRFVGAFQTAYELLQKKVIGDIYHFTAEAYGPVVLKPKGMTWRTKSSEGGGCLHDYASHVVNLVNYLIGRPDGVIGTVLKPVYSKHVEDAVYATLLYKNGISGQLAVNWSDETYRKMSTQIEIYGTNGKIIADRQECKIYLRNETAQGLTKGWNILYTTDVTKPVYFYVRGEEYSAQIDYFVQKIKNHDMENINSFESAVQTDVVLDWLIADAKQRR